MNFAGKRTLTNDQRQKSNLPSVLPPTSISSLAIFYLNYIIKRILLIKVETRIFVYISIICLGSLLTDIFPIPQTYFSNKRNFFNMYMVKVGWGWTLSLLIPFVG